MGKLIDLTGQKFGRLIVEKRVPAPEKVKEKTRAYWSCRCECGSNKNVIVSGKQLRECKTLSCGCLLIEKLKQYNEKQRKNNIFQLNENYIVGITNKGNFHFDILDLEKVKNINRCWHINKNRYVIIKYKGKEIKLQNFLMEPPVGFIVDHIDGDTLNNRRSNLRICKEIDNAKNKGIQINNTSGVKGVNWNCKLEQWQVRIGYNKKRIHLGYFNDFEEAVKVRKEAEKYYFKEFNRIV